jgi:acetyltransferase-like isoleucine patch superfamily enzyme
MARRDQQSETATPQFPIGVDPHKGSHTAAVLDARPVTPDSVTSQIQPVYLWHLTTGYYSPTHVGRDASLGGAARRPYRQGE